MLTGEFQRNEFVREFIREIKNISIFDRKQKGNVETFPKLSLSPSV
jgi:hypothetical protein